jgi:O-antigen ligase
MALPGWAARPAPVPPADTAPAPGPVVFGRWPIERIIRPWQGVEWSVMYVAFLGFVFVVTTLRIPAGMPLMVIGLLCLFFQRAKFRMPAWLALFGLFVLWCLVGLLQTKYHDIVLVAFVEVAKRFLIALVAVNALRTRAQIRFFVVFWLFCYAAYPVRGTLTDYFIVGSTLLGRAVWIEEYSNPNSLAAITLLMLAVVVTVLAGRYDFGSKLAAAGGFALLPLIVLLTQSRAAFIALIVATFATLLGQKRRARSFLIVGAVGMVALATMPESALTRIKNLRYATSTDYNTLMEVDKEGSANQRWLIWTVAGGVIENHLFAGAGIGAYPVAHGAESRSAKYKGGRGNRDPHSTYISVLGETGIPGFVLFVGMILVIVVDSLRVRLRARFVLPMAAAELRYLHMGLLAFAIAAIWGTFDRLTHFYFYLALIWCLTAVTRQELAARQRGGRPMTA